MGALYRAFACYFEADHVISIRNYMSKSWFLKMALEAEPTPLAKQIASALKKPPTDA